MPDVQTTRIQGPILQRAVSYKYAFEDHKLHHEDAFVEEVKQYEVLKKDEYFVCPTEERKTLQGEKNLREFENLLFNG
jgi:hypothetical protein